MARTADHDARRRQVADAVRELIPAVGFDGLTMTRIAAQAGISVGLVQHYFPNKDEVLLHTYRETVRGARARIDRRIAEGDRRALPIRAVLLDAFAETLPLDPVRRVEYRISQAFLGRALDNSALAEVAVENAAAIRAEVIRAVENGKKCGEVASTIDGDAAALFLLALLDGLAARLYYEPNVRVAATPMRASVLATLRDCMAEVFTGECRHYRQ